MKPEDFEKIFSFIRNDHERLKVELVELIKHTIHFELIEVKDAIAAVNRRQDQDYGFLGLADMEINRKVAQNTKDIKIIKKKLNL